MPYFAIINGSTVNNIILADDLETANGLAINTRMGQFAIQVSKEPGSPGIGWVWDGTQLIEPEPNA